MTERVKTDGPGEDEECIRDCIVDCALALIRAGQPNISRSQIASQLTFDAKIVADLFPRSFDILIEAVERASDLWLQRFTCLLGQPDLSPVAKLDRLQRQILTLYAGDPYVIELQTSLWREARVPTSLLRELKQHTRMIIAECLREVRAGEGGTGDETSIDQETLVDVIWGACEQSGLRIFVADRTRVFDSELLAAGQLVLAGLSSGEDDQAVRAQT